MCGPWRPPSLGPLSGSSDTVGWRQTRCETFEIESATCHNWIIQRNSVFTRWQHAAAAACWWFAFRLLWRTFNPGAHTLSFLCSSSDCCQMNVLIVASGREPRNHYILREHRGCQQRTLLEQSSYCRRNCWRKYWFYCRLQLKVKCPSSKNQWHLYCAVSVSKLTSSHINHLEVIKLPVNTDILKIMNIKDKEITKNFKHSNICFKSAHDWGESCCQSINLFSIVIS